MSSILRALRKLDEDSISRESPPGEQKVKMKYMVHQPTKTSRVITRTLLAAVALLSVITVILILEWNPRSIKEQTPQPVEERTPRPEKNRQVQPPEAKLPQPVQGPVPRPVKERPIRPEGKQRQPLERLETPTPIIQSPTAKIPAREAAKPGPSIKETKHPALNLEGILWSQEAARRLALINNRYLKEGDTIEGASIVRIGKKEVTFQMGDEKWTMHLKK